MIWLGVGFGIIAVVLLVQGARGYSGSERRWVDAREHSSGWPFLGLFWMGTGAASFSIAMFIGGFGGSPSLITVGLGLYFFAGVGIGWIFTHGWMPRFLLPEWARDPMEAGLEVTNLANLELWEKLVAEGWPREEAARHVTQTAVAEGRRESRCTVEFDSATNAQEFVRLLREGIAPREASLRTEGCMTTVGVSVGLADLLHPKITVSGQPFQPESVQ